MNGTSDITSHINHSELKQTADQSEASNNSQSAVAVVSVNQSGVTHVAGGDNSTNSNPDYNSWNFDDNMEVN